jgi:uncharacterized repeat protein (TIGR01451 family)
VGAPNPAVLGNTIAWTMVVANNGPNGATGVTVGDPIPAGTTFVAVTSSQGTCTGGVTVNCDLGSMAVGTSVTITLITTAVFVIVPVAFAVVSGNEQETDTSNTATASVVVNGPFKPPVTYCTAVNVQPKQLFVGRSTLIRMRIVQHGKRVENVRVQIKGKQVGVVLGKTKTGKLIVRVPNAKKGLVFTYLAKKHRWVLRGTKAKKGLIVTKPSTKKGVVTIRVYPMRAGIVTFAPVASKSCANPRVGITGVFTPPVTG